MIVREAEPPDLPAVLTLHREAFETDAEAKLVEALVTDPTFVPEYSLVAEDPATGDIVGHVMLSWASVEGGCDCCEGAACEIPLLCLAPLSVRPAHQRQGVGTALVTEVLARSREAGEDAVLVLGDPKYYARFGFQQAPPFVRPPADVPPEAWMVLEFVPGALSSADGVVRFAEAFGDPALW